MGEQGCLGKIKLKEALPLICLLSCCFCHFSVLLSPSLPPSLPTPFDLHFSFHGFSIIFSSYFQWGSHFVRSYIPVIAHVSPHPQWLENPSQAPSTSSCLSSSSASQHLFIYFFTFLDPVFVSYCSLLTLSFYPLRKWHIRVLFLWADLWHSHLNAAMTGDYLAIVHFFHSICKLPWSTSKGIIIRKIKHTKASSIILS